MSGGSALMVQETAGQVKEFAAEAASLASDPLGTVITVGLDLLISLVQPLEDLLAMVTGQSDAIDDQANVWEKVASDLRASATDTQSSAHPVLTNKNKGWVGEASENCSRRMDFEADTLDELAGLADAVANALRMSATVMRAAEDLIKGILALLIEFIVVTQAAAWAAAVPSCGASVAAGEVACVAETGVATTVAATKVQKTSQLLAKVGEIVRDSSTRFAKHASQIDGVRRPTMGELGRETANLIGETVFSAQEGRC